MERRFSNCQHCELTMIVGDGTVPIFQVNVVLLPSQSW